MNVLAFEDLSKRFQSQGANYLAWSSLADPMLIGLMARAGYDAVLLDQQHGFHDLSSCVATITEATLARIPVIVRVGVGDFAEAARLLDVGAAGVVAPMINSASDARLFGSFVKYPPMGGRSFGPGRAMYLQGATDGLAYLKAANSSSLAIAMCETREAIAALEEILAEPTIDGVLAGPSDLSIALSGGQLEAESSAVRAATVEIAQRARAAGKLACAFAGSVERTRELVREGYQLVSVSYDEKLILDSFAEALRKASK
jgi:4-hydroxy-2-oxoheptanedioate aldolase